MYSRYLIAAATALAIAGSAAAEPPKPASTGAAQPAPGQPAKLVLASADQITPPAAVTQASAPAKKPRAARVTSCRCAGQTAQTEQ